MNDWMNGEYIYFSWEKYKVKANYQILIFCMFNVFTDFTYFIKNNFIEWLLISLKKKLIFYKKQDKQ